jgi:hypothetical protein
MVGPEGHTRRISLEEFWDPAIVVMEETAQTLVLPWRDSWEILGTQSFQEREGITLVVRIPDADERLIMAMMWPHWDKWEFWRRAHQRRCA